MVSGLALAVAATATIALVALSRIPQPPTWLAVLIAGVAFCVGLAADPFKKLSGEWIEQPRRQHAALLAHTRMHSRSGRLQRVRNCANAMALGVHPAARAETADGDAGQPPYVERDLQERLKEAADEGGLVILEGASTAGKSRLAYEFVRESLPDRWLVVPAGPTSLRDIALAGVPIGNAVIWLDDIDRHLIGGGLDGSVLDALCPQDSKDVLMLATLRAEARNELTDVRLETAISRAVDDVMRRARVLYLDLKLTERERTRAADLRSDLRIAAALDQPGDAGFAEYLAAGPAALERWQSAHHGQNVVAGAIISAAIDVRRAGLPGPISRSLLASGVPLYLDHRSRERQSDDAFDLGIEWAIQPVKGASSCLVPVGTENFEPFDYLVDHVQRTESIDTIPGALWSELISTADIADLTPIGLSAYRAGRSDISEEAFLRIAESGEEWANGILGFLQQEAGRMAEADTSYRRAAESGQTSAMFNLAKLHKELGDQEQAEQWYRRAADDGHKSAAYNLAKLLKGQDEAEQWYRQAAEAGHPGAMNNLGVLLVNSGRRTEALEWFRSAADAGSVDAMCNLGSVLDDRAKNEEAEAWYRRAAEANHGSAMNNLGLSLHNRGLKEEAEEWYRRATEAGNPTAAYNLATLLTQDNRKAEAETWFRQAAEAGQSKAMYALGLHHTEVDRDEAESWFYKAAKAGHGLAMYELAALLMKRRRNEEAEYWFLRAAEAGQDEAMYQHAFLLMRMDMIEEAELWLRRAAEMNHDQAMYLLAALLEKRGRNQEAENWFRLADPSGRAVTQYHLRGMLRNLHEPVPERMDRSLFENDKSDGIIVLDQFLDSREPEEADTPQDKQES
ncbi:hypothetical protein Aple_078940 [Acrocarpospora pleiomorpha]|uniref:Sel1 repeat family protein n=1 Tax=Acrocarpospora pleiomorpha TaxID=90975 RepID=A0A5M3XUW9_9ACTN|nr:tetratricopeptide repeat protein [Acrocarpospora pleiomorpha]GES24995.1 hypothetical protein Aple_078940 [Acrocarpospora pleiomorpha]